MKDSEAKINLYIALIAFVKERAKYYNESIEANFNIDDYAKERAGRLNRLEITLTQKLEELALKVLEELEKTPEQLEGQETIKFKKDGSN